MANTILSEVQKTISMYLKKKLRKLKKITFVCGGIYPATINDEKKIFRNLVMFGKKIIIKFIF